MSILPRYSRLSMFLCLVRVLMRHFHCKHLSFHVQINFGSEKIHAFSDDPVFWLSQLIFLYRPLNCMRSLSYIILSSNQELALDQNALVRKIIFFSKEKRGRFILWSMMTSSAYGLASGFLSVDRLKFFSRKIQLLYLEFPLVVSDLIISDVY